MESVDDTDTFIAVAPDTAATSGVVPPSFSAQPSSMIMPSPTRSSGVLVGCVSSVVDETGREVAGERGG
jgi:hypothetical protein